MLDVLFYKANIKSKLKRKSSSDSPYINCVIILVMLWISNHQHAWSNANILGDLKAIKGFQVQRGVIILTVINVITSNLWR